MLKKLATFSLFICIGLLIFFIIKTYGKYSNQLPTPTTINLTKWKLLVNDQDIYDNSDISTTIIPTFTSTTHISENIIAPGSTGYFDIEIDSSETDLSFSYSITISNTDSDVSDFNITGYSINNGSTNTYSGAIENEILYSDNIDTTTIRFYMQWVDVDDNDNTNPTNNAADTDLSLDSATGTITATISLDQILEESE